VPWREHLHGWRGGSLPDMRMGRIVRRAVNMTGPARRAAESPAPARTARAAGTAAAATALAGCGFEADDTAALAAPGLFDAVEFDALALVERLESSPVDGGVDRKSTRLHS